jgi:hypothetical protein
MPEKINNSETQFGNNLLNSSIFSSNHFLWIFHSNSNHSSSLAANKFLDEFDMEKYSQIFQVLKVRNLKKAQKYVKGTGKGQTKPKNGCNWAENFMKKMRKFHSNF